MMHITPQGIVDGLIGILCGAFVIVMIWLVSSAGEVKNGRE